MTIDLLKFAAPWERPDHQPDFRFGGAATPATMDLPVPEWALRHIVTAVSSFPMAEARIPDRAITSNKLSTADGQIIEFPFEGPAWVFFLDLAPGAPWAHECRYIAVVKGRDPYLIEAWSMPDRRADGIRFIHQRALPHIMHRRTPSAASRG